MNITKHVNTVDHLKSGLIRHLNVTVVAKRAINVIFCSIKILDYVCMYFILSQFKQTTKNMGTKKPKKINKIII